MLFKNVLPVAGRRVRRANPDESPQGYKVTDTVIGEGGYGIVFVCKHPTGSTDFAAKRINLSHTMNDDDTPTTHLNARGEVSCAIFLSRLNIHPPVLDYYETDAAMVMVMHRMCPFPLLHMNNDTYAHCVKPSTFLTLLEKAFEVHRHGVWLGDLTVKNVLMQKGYTHAQWRGDSVPFDEWNCQPNDVDDDDYEPFIIDCGMALPTEEPVTGLLAALDIIMLLFGCFWEEEFWSLPWFHPVPEEHRKYLDFFVEFVSSQVGGRDIMHKALRMRVNPNGCLDKPHYKRFAEPDLIGMYRLLFSNVADTFVDRADDLSSRAYIAWMYDERVSIGQRDIIRSIASKCVLQLE